MYIHTYCTHIYTYIIYMYIYIYVCVYIYIYMYVHIHMYIYIYIYMYAHTMVRPPDVGDRRDSQQSGQYRRLWQTRVLCCFRWGKLSNHSSTLPQIYLRLRCIHARHDRAGPAPTHLRSKKPGAHFGEKRYWFWLIGVYAYSIMINWCSCMNISCGNATPRSPPSFCLFDSEETCCGPDEFLPAWFYRHHYTRSQ